MDLLRKVLKNYWEAIIAIMVLISIILYLSYSAVNNRNSVGICDYCGKEIYYEDDTVTTTKERMYHADCYMKSLKEE